MEIAVARMPVLLLVSKTKTSRTYTQEEECSPGPGFPGLECVVTVVTIENSKKPVNPIK